MKTIEKTAVPRKQELNAALVSLGHKTHADKRRKKLSRDKQEKHLDKYEDWN